MLADRAALRQALGQLGPRQRAVIVLRFWLDLSEAADGWPPPSAAP
jgi:DNA-directed RNA polymerase specialized sigma24 family protein